jgi:Tetratricopeptide repeat
MASLPGELTMLRPRTIGLSALCAFSLFAFARVVAQERPLADPADLAFEEGRWEDAIREYHELLEGYPEDRISWLRIAQAERELGRYDAALASLDRAMANEAPEAMIHLERARNYLGLGREGDALDELDEADHLELRARVLLEEADDFDAIRDSRRFQRVYRSVRARVLPCEGIPEAAQFDFWLGTWEVRGTDGGLLGQSRVTRDEGGCVVREQWEGVAGTTGTSMSVYLPSRGQWQHVWVGSGGTYIDMTGGFEDGEMRLEGTIEYLDGSDVVAFRSTWSVGAEGRVRQQMEQFSLGTQNWQVWFDGIYTRSE